MLEHIFGSITRTKILGILFRNPKKSFFVRELTRETGMQLNAVRREIENLVRVGILLEVAGESAGKEANESDALHPKLGKKSSDYVEKLKKYYALNQGFLLFHEFQSLLLKSRVFAEQNLVKRICEVGKIHLLLLAGVFVGMEKSRTDMLLVGAIDRKKLQRIITEFEKDLSSKINYTVMNPGEYKYRKEITDRFLYDILENKHIVAIERAAKEGV